MKRLTCERDGITGNKNVMLI